jgi:hypothetical protein
MHAGSLSRRRGRPATLTGVTGFAPGAAVVAVTAVATLLRLWSVTSVAANPFYDAAVRSMGQSWHNLFYGAFEPGGQVSIDKVPDCAPSRTIGAHPGAAAFPLQGSSDAQDRVTRRAALASA